MFGTALCSKSVYFYHKIGMSPLPNDICLPIKRSIIVLRKKTAVNRTRLKRQACQLKRNNKHVFKLAPDSIRRKW